MWNLVDVYRYFEQHKDNHFTLYSDEIGSGCALGQYGKDQGLKGIDVGCYSVWYRTEEGLQYRQLSDEEIELAARFDVQFTEKLMAAQLDFMIYAGQDILDILEGMGITQTICEQSEAVAAAQQILQEPILEAVVAQSVLNCTDAGQEEARLVLASTA